jgi:hypothetical protein
MHPYRIYLIDEAGHILAPAVVIECGDDQEASAEAVKHTNGNSAELWDGARLVVRFPSDETVLRKSPQDHHGNSASRLLLGPEGS